MRIAWDSPWFTLMLGAFAALPAVSIDLSAPTLVDLPAALNTTATIAGLTLSLFMLGFALGLLAGGKASDRFGRRPVLLASLLLYCAAGVFCAIATSGPGLVAARTVQGFGAGACSVMASAMVQDLFQGEAARRKRSYVATVNGIVPVLAPALGAWLSVAAGWRSVPIVLAVAGTMLLGVVSAAVAESRPAIRLPRVGPLLEEGMLRLRDDRRFLSLALINALSYGALFAYIAGAPVVTMRNMGLSAGTYAAVFASTALALSAGAFASARLGKRYPSAASLIWPSLATQAAATIALALFAAEHVTPAFILLPLLLVTCFTRGIIAPNMLHLTIGLRKRDAGMASALFGVLQLLGGALSSAAVAALLPYYGPFAVATIMALMTGTAAALWLLTAQRFARVRPIT